MGTDPSSHGLAAPAGDDRASMAGRRAASRLRLAVPARFISIYSQQPCILLDLSRTGARMAVSQPVAPGKTGYVAIGRLELFGSIVRVERGPHMAVNAMAFDDPISREEVLAVRSFAEGLEEREHRALREQVRRWVTGQD